MPGCPLAFPFETVRVKWPPDPLCAYTSGRTPTPSPLPGCIGPLVPALYCTGLLDSGPRAPCASSSGRLHARTDAYSLATESAATRPVVGRPCLPCRRTGPLHSTRLQADFHTIAAAWPAAGRQRLPCCCSGPYHWPPQLRTSSALHPPNDRLHIRTLSPSPSGRLPPCSRPTARASPAAMPGILDFGPRVRTLWRMPLEPLVFGPRAATPALVHLRPGATTRRSAAPPADGRPRLPCRRSGPINPGPRVPALAFFFPPIPGLPRAFLHASSPPPYLPRPIRPCGPPPELQPTPRAALFPRTRHSRPHPGLPLLSYPVGTPRALPVPDDALEPCTRLVTAHTGSPQWPRTHGRPLVPRPGPLLDRPDHHGEPHGKCLNESVAARDNHARVAAARPSVDLNSIPQPLTCAPPLLPAP